MATREIAAKPNRAFAGAIGNQDNQSATRFRGEVEERHAGVPHV
jgi:hypothetical protein